MNKTIITALLLLFSLGLNASTKYIATTGNDSSGDGSSANPYLTMNKCYQVVAATAIPRVCILKNSLSYAAQSLSGSAGIPDAYSPVPDAADVLFQPETVGAVKIADLNFTGGVDHVIVENIDVGNTGISFSKANCIHLRGSSARRMKSDGTLFIGNPSDQTINGRPTYLSFQWLDNDASRAGLKNDFSVQLWIGMNQVLFEDCIVQGARATTPTSHPDGVKIYAADGGAIVDNVTFRRCKFINNEHINFRGNFNASYTLENNFFGPPCDFGQCSPDVTITTYYSLQIADDGGVVLRNNSIIGSLELGNNNNNRAITGNIVTGQFEGGCPGGSGTTATYNVWSTANSATCGSNNLRVASFSGWFTSLAPQNADLHLTASATQAFNAGNPANFPIADIDGEGRTSPPDAGADEFQGGPPPPPTEPPTNVQATVRP